MSILETLIGPLAKIIDKVIPDKEARERAKLELLRLEGTQEMELIQAQRRRSWPRPVRPIHGPAAHAPVSFMSCTQ